MKTVEMEQPQQMSAVRVHFDEYAAGWHDRLKQHAFHARFIAVKELKEGLPCNSVLDIGCGTGDYCTLFDLAENRYLGLDISPEMIRICRDLYPEFSFEVTEGDSIQLIDGSMDLVLDIAVIEYYDDPMPHLRELRRIVHDDGNLIIAVPNGTKGAKALYTRLGRTLRRLKAMLFSRSKDVPIDLMKDSHIKHRAKTLMQMKDMSHAAGFELVRQKYVNVMLFPEFRPFVHRLNNCLSRCIGGRAGWQWITSWSATILVCHFRPQPTWSNRNPNGPH